MSGSIQSFIELSAESARYRALEKFIGPYIFPFSLFEGLLAYIPAVEVEGEHS